MASAVAVMSAFCGLLVNSWHSHRSDEIRLAALQDVLNHPDGPRNHPELVVCVEVETGQEILKGPGRSGNPSSTLLRGVRGSSRTVVPQSECERTRDGVRHRRSGAPAVIIGVSAPRCVAEEFCRIEAFWFYDGLSSVGLLYTVSFDEGRWTVDTEKMLWIS